MEFFNSLTISIKDGGVMYRNNNLVSIAEVPMNPHGWILNGWLSSIVNLDKANEVLKNNKITEFIQKNIKTLEKVLPLYDVKKLCISRYNLTQFFYFRVLKSNYSIKNVSFIYPLDSKITITYKNGIVNRKSRWEPYVLNKGNIKLKNNLFIGKKIFQFNGVLTLSGYPKQNIIEIDFNDKIRQKDIRFQVYIGKYDPLHSSPVNKKWIDINNFKIKGEKLIVTLPYKLFNDMIGYPTNFMKKFYDGRRNAYHDIHIKWLRYLGNKYYKKLFLEIADKWYKCKAKWKYIESYKNLFKKNKVLLHYEFYID